MLPTPCTAADQHAGSPRRSQGQNGTSPPADNARAWPQRRTSARRGAIPVTIYSIGRTRIKEKKGPAVLEAFLSLDLPPLSLCNLLFPFVYKRGNRMPHGGDGGTPLYTAVDIKTHALTRLRSTRTLETWDLSLSRSFVISTINFQC